MTNKYKLQNRMSKRSKNFMGRFRTAYERLSYVQRQLAQKTFCEVHQISAGTFRNKMNGFTTLFETEVEWMEDYDPYKQPQLQAVQP